MHTRRAFVAALVSAVPLVHGRAFAVWTRRTDHPDPRPGIDASRVLPPARLRRHPEAARVFDLVREIPHVVDGIRCQCGCGDMPDKYSLLSCFERDGMARRCDGCQAQARRVHALHAEGRSLAEIRDAIDREFGR